MHSLIRNRLTARAASLDARLKTLGDLDESEIIRRQPGLLEKVWIARDCLMASELEAAETAFFEELRRRRKSGPEV